MPQQTGLSKGQLITTNWLPHWYFWLPGTTRQQLISNPAGFGQFIHTYLQLKSVKHQSLDRWQPFVWSCLRVCAALIKSILCFSGVLSPWFLNDGNNDVDGDIHQASVLHVLLGVLACLDGYMNIALEQTEEYANGQVK